MSEIIL